MTKISSDRGNWTWRKLAMDHVQPKKKVVSRSHRQLSYSSQQDQSFRRSHFEKVYYFVKLKLNLMQSFNFRKTKNWRQKFVSWKNSWQKMEIVPWRLIKAKSLRWKKSWTRCDPTSQPWKQGNGAAWKDGVDRKKEAVRWSHHSTRIK